jgi:hypothetical protein
VEKPKLPLAGGVFSFRTNFHPAGATEKWPLSIQYRGGKFRHSNRHGGMTAIQKINAGDQE